MFVKVLHPVFTLGGPATTPTLPTLARGEEYLHQSVWLEILRIFQNFSMAVPPILLVS